MVYKQAVLGFSLVVLCIGSFFGGMFLERFTFNYGARSGPEVAGPRNFLVGLSTGNGKMVWDSYSDYYQQLVIQDHGGDTVGAIADEVSFYNNNNRNIQSMDIQYLGGYQADTYGAYTYRTVTHTKDGQTIPFVWLFLVDDKGLLVETK